MNTNIDKRQIRIFISSTFQDMQEEREISLVGAMYTMAKRWKIMLLVAILVFAAGYGFFVFKNRKAATQMVFEARSEVARDSILEAARKGVNCDEDRNPYFFVQDFPEPKPTFLRGDEGGDIVQVRYNGAYKLCSRATMELFNLEFVRDW